MYKSPLKSSLVIGKALTLSALVLSALLVGACSGLLKSDQPTKHVFLLQPLSSSAASAVTAEPMPLVISSRVVPGLDTDRILVLGYDASLTPVANARWADNLPEVMNSIVRRSLTLSGRYAPAFDDRKKVGLDSQLQLELQAFYGIGTASGEPDRVEIKIEGRLTCQDTQHAIQIDQSESVNGSGLSRIVAAHQGALNEAMEALLHALDTHCQQV